MIKITALCSAAGVAVVLSQSLPQAAEAKHHSRPVYYGQSYYYGGIPGYSDFGGATVFPDGSFTNNGYSWNGADPAGGWSGHVAYPGVRRAIRYR